MRKKKIKRRNGKIKIKIHTGLLLLSIVLLVFIYFYFKSVNSSYISPVIDISGNQGEIVKILRDAKLSVASASASSGYYLVTLKDGPDVIFSMDKDLDQQVSSLQLLLSRFTIEGKSVRRVDFRFDKPVISQ